MLEDEFSRKGQAYMDVSQSDEPFSGIEIITDFAQVCNLSKKSPNLKKHTLACLHVRAQSKQTIHNIMLMLPTHEEFQVNEFIT